MLADQFLTPALLLRRLEHGENGLMVTFFTQKEGRISVLVPGGRKSIKRYGGVLEAFHTLEILVKQKGPSTDSLMLLGEASLLRARSGILSHLSALQAGGTALRWIRCLSPFHLPDPIIWNLLEEWLDTLDKPSSSPFLELVHLMFRLLVHTGYRLELERCVRCQKPCGPAKKATVDVIKGGLLCTSCGGGGRLMESSTRMACIQLQLGQHLELSPGQIDELLNLIYAVFKAHMGLSL
ncbi:DNA repair protein RecO [Pajaroellobacter abortibovis]|uniref:DNA repair protein RecO n=1 Tax=Pajaroellobacter abortibovis TaxID=1882918 RepID=A0A1L6MXZ6_9BACT|nr:DNA repair protein RecO [Pajaroellobacter abortibovis]APS00317.1 DNA repair protein RecO [Pajaroellobacter abortibovis]